MYLQTWREKQRLEYVCILGAFAKLQKSSRLSVRTEQLDSQGMDFRNT
jgi:hypothetical protein